MPRDICRLRNIGIMAHVDAGKTTCAERILFLAGRIRTKGEVHHGNTHFDHLPLERQKGITIQASAGAVPHTPSRGPFAGIAHRLQLIDTPGHVDFTIEVERSLRVLDGAISVLDAASGVECQSETVFRQAAAHRVPCLAFVNKIDKPGADFAACLRDIEERLGVRPVPLGLPARTEDGALAVADVLARELVVDRDEGRVQERLPLPPSMMEEVETARRRVIEICAEVDEHVLEAFCSGRDVEERELARALRTVTLERRALVVLAGAALQDCGIPALLDAVVSYLPSPLDRPPVEGIDPRTGEASSRAPEATAPLSALAFKATFDRNAGLITWLRIYSGTLHSGDAVVVLPRNVRERVGRVFLPDAAGREEVDEASAGSVVCVTGLGSVRTGETLSDPRAAIALESIRVPDAVVSIVVEPKTASDRDRFGSALTKLVACDPSLRFSVDPETGQTVLSGMGRLHLEIAVASLCDEHGIALTTGKPRVAYRTTIGRTMKVSYRHKKQGGGPGQFAGVTLEVAPGERGSGVAFADESRGGVIPKDLVPAVERGVRMAAERGIGATRAVASPPVVDIVVRLLDGETHVRDSNAVAFEIAAAAAFEEAVVKAGIVLLEPVAFVEITSPEPNTGDVLGDLGSRRGLVRAVNPREARGLVVVEARIPLAATFDYVPRLRAITHGRGEARITPDGYEVVPDGVAAGLLAELH
jgi:elongation factor G